MKPQAKKQRSKSGIGSDGEEARSSFSVDLPVEDSETEEQSKTQISNL